jgi:hypothetical protein
MDPWLEHPALWPDVHNSLIAAIRDVLAPLVDPRYYVGIQSRMTTVTLDETAPRSYRPDVAITPGDAGAVPHGHHGALEAGGDVAVIEEVDALEVVLPVEDDVEETYLRIHEVGTHRLVTALEILSPSNKAPGKGRDAYLEKRAELFGSRTSLVEIDLLRAGAAMPLGHPVQARDYRILVARGRTRPRALPLTFGVRAAVPTIPIPLLPEDEEPRLDLNRVLHDLIDRARYFRRLDYSQPPVPPLRPADAEWTARIVAEARTRE